MEQIVLDWYLFTLTFVIERVFNNIYIVYCIPSYWVLYTLNLNLSCAFQLGVDLSSTFLSKYDFRLCTLKLHFLKNKTLFGKDFAVSPFSMLKNFDLSQEHFLFEVKLRFLFRHTLDLVFLEIILNLTVHWVYIQTFGLQINDDPIWDPYENDIISAPFKSYLNNYVKMNPSWNFIIN